MMSARRPLIFDGTRARAQVASAYNACEDFTCSMDAMASADAGG